LQANLLTLWDQFVDTMTSMKTFALVVLLAGLAAVHAAGDQQTGTDTFL